MEKFNIDDKVAYLLDQIEQYKVVATKTQPRKRPNMNDASVPSGFDYLIVKTNREYGEFGTFIPVIEAHLVEIK